MEFVRLTWEKRLLDKMPVWAIFTIYRRFATYELNSLPAGAKGLAIWIIEGQILSRQEIQYLIDLTKEEPKIKIVLENGWRSLC